MYILRTSDSEFLQAGCFSCHQFNVFKALTGNQTTDANHGESSGGVILSLNITRLHLRDGALMPAV